MTVLDLEPAAAPLAPPALRATGGLGDRGPTLPAPRGPITGALLRHLRHPRSARLPGPGAVDGALEDDGQLALHCCYELAYRGFAGVDDELEWDPVVLDLRARLERILLRDLQTNVPVPDPSTNAVEVMSWLRDTARPGDGPSVSGFVSTEGTLAHLREFCTHRSAYQLKEADPHTWALPRLAGEAKAAMVEIQADEYGGGVGAEMHASLFADTLDELGLDAAYGAHLDRLPGVTLATGNVISLFGLHRRWRGALVGHLALFEMTSIGPMGRYAAAIERLVGSARARRFYDVHVEADEHHQVVALDRMVAGLLADEPGLVLDVAFGAGALMLVEGRLTEHLMRCWGRGESSLLAPEPVVGRRAS